MDIIQIDKTSILNGKPKLISSKYSKIIIGKYCAIAEGLKIITLNHDYNFPAIQGTFYKNNFNCSHPGEIITPPNKIRTKGDVIIGNDVWIGEDVLILSGITIGHGCCIAAKSVVTKSLPPYTICVGTPCKPVKKRYNENIVKFLLDLNWWDWDIEKIRKNKKFFVSNLNDIDDVNIINSIIN